MLPIDKQYPVRDVQTAPVDKVNLGMIGAGNFATSTLLPKLRGMDGLELAAIASARGLKSSHAADRYGFGYAATETEQILQDESINTIAILTRHDLHAALTVSGLSAGKNVFCEKPLALDLDQLEDVTQALNETDMLLMVGFNRRFASLSKALKSFMDSTPGPKVMTYRINAGPLPSNHWLYDPVEGGGRIIGEACHFIDFLTYIANALPIKVRTIGVDTHMPDHEDNVIIALDFADGSIGSISYLASGDRSFSKERVEVFGGGKVAVLDDFRSLELVTDGKRSRQRSRLRQDKGHKAEWEAFVKAIQTGGPPPIPYKDLIAVTKTSIAAVKSLRTQQSVDIKTLTQN